MCKFFCTFVGKEMKNFKNKTLCLCVSVYKYNLTI